MQRKISPETTKYWAKRVKHSTSCSKVNSSTRTAFSTPVLTSSHFAVIETRRRAKIAGRQGTDANDNPNQTPRGPAGTSLFEERKGKDKSSTKSSSTSKPGKLNASQLRDLEAKKEKEAAKPPLWPSSVLRRNDRTGSRTSQRNTRSTSDGR